MAKYKLDELCEFITDGTHQTPEYCDDGVIFLSSKDVTERKINWDDVRYIPDELHEKLYKRLSPRKNDILLAKNGTTGVAAIVDRDEIFDVYVSLAVLRPLETIYPKYLLYAINSPVAKRQFNAGLKGIGVPNLHLGVIRETIVNVAQWDEQEKVCEILDRVANLMEKRKTELDMLDNLIKARFVEMFGDPIINSFEVETKPMTDVCEIIDGDRGKNYPTTDEFSDEGYCLFLNAKNVTSTGFNFDTCMFVTKEKDEALRKGKLSRGDVVLTTRGTLGNLAFYTEDIPFEHVRINSGMVILRMKQDVVDEVYFIEQFKMQLADIREKIASGSAQPQLPISTMNKINILIPGIEKQRQFADFVKQVDKSKVAVQKALDETQMLFDSLMQKYFV